MDKLPKAALSFGVAQRMERLPLTSYQRHIFLIIATAWFFDSMDLGMMTFILGSIKADFGLSAAQTGLLGSASFLGMFLGAATSGMLADRFGRRIVFQWSMVFWGAASFACAMAENVNQLIAFRIVLGFGMGMEFPIGQSMVSELLPAKQRGRYVAMLEGFWPIGFIAAGILAYVLLPIGGWRSVFWALGIPAVFVLIVRRYVPESPRWLEEAGRHEEADKVMSKFEANVRKAQGHDRLPEPAPTMARAEAPAKGSSFSQLWTNGYASRTLMLWALWFFALLGYYGITTWLGALLQQAGYEVTKSVYYTVMISLAGIPGFITAAFLLEWWGRKPTLILMLLGSAASAFMYGSTAANVGSQVQLIGFGLCMQFFMFGMWSVLYAYTPELYPTRIRATGSGFASSVGRLGSLLGPLIIGVVLPTMGQTGVFALGAASFVVAATVVLLFGLETKGKTLEEISE